MLSGRPNDIMHVSSFRGSHAPHVAHKLGTCCCQLNSQSAAGYSCSLYPDEAAGPLLEANTLTHAISIQVTRPDEESFEVILQPNNIQGYTFALQLYPVLKTELSPQLLQNTNPNTGSCPLNFGVNESVARNAEDSSISECAPVHVIV
jgi:hypothetical protein